jgi:uncharacterized protein (TIGR02246 family)
MTRRFIAALLLPLLLAACRAGIPSGAEVQAGATGAEQGVRAEIVSLLDRLNEAATRKDVDAFMSLWERSNAVVYTRSGRTFIGWDAIAADHTTAFAGGDPWRFEAAETHVQVLGPDAGAATAFVRSTAYDADGEARHGWFTITVAARASADGWRIVQAHGSYPGAGTTPRGEPEPLR